MEKILAKLEILAEAAKYDVSCSSSGVERKNNGKGIGNATSSGICHTWTADGRCVSLLKILMSNDCVYDCHYCCNRLTNDFPRASFTPDEIATLTMEFYKRNYIEGLFLSSAIDKNPDHTMENLCRTLELLRTKYHFNGYIHVKAIPNADISLINRAGFSADRLSLNIELPTQESLKILAPQKNLKNLLLPISSIGNRIITNQEERKIYKNAPKFIPAGQSTQMMVGASNDTDHAFLSASQYLYDRHKLKRVFYSAYIPILDKTNLPSVATAPPLKREHRLYQADWLMRFYRFNANELLSDKNQNLDLDYDPKIAWAFNNMDEFPIEVNKVSYDRLLRIPGIGPVSAKRIIEQRRLSPVTYEGLKKMGVVMKRAKYFITCQSRYFGGIDLNPEIIKYKLGEMEESRQLSFWR